MIADVRSNLLAALSDLEIPVYNMLPEVEDDFTPPGLIVVPAVNGSYIVGGQVKGIVEITLDVYVAVKNADVNTEIQEIDSLVESILVRTLDWGLRGVDAPGLINIQGVSYPGTVIHLAIQQDLEI